MPAPMALPAESEALEIRVLGPLDVRAAGRPLIVDTRKALAILALLAVDRRPFAREELAAVLWPESDDASARGALRRTLSVLRTALRDRWLLVDRSTVALDTATVWIDLATIDAAIRSASIDRLRGAASEVRGPLLAGFSLRDSPEFDDWRATRAVAVERTVAELLDRLADAMEASGDLAGAVAAGARRVDLDPLDEPAHRRLMGLLARSGDRAGAIRQYRACVAVLERELGVTPLAETTALYEAIRDERPPATASPDAGNTPTGASDGSGEGTPPAPVRLPLVGRDAELRALMDAHGAAGIDGRVAHVTGEAGIGKSRLAESVRSSVNAAGGTTLVARSFASEAGIAYGLIVELLRVGLARPDAVDRLRELPDATVVELERLVPMPADLSRRRPVRAVRAATDDGPAARVRLLEAVASALVALVAGPVPGLITVEDLQWADDASRESLVWLGRRLAGRPVLLLLTWRPEDLDELGAAFVATIETLPGATAISLRRLGREDVEQLVAAASVVAQPPMAVDMLLQESEGLPLYVVEALATGTGLIEGPARSVRTLLRERLVSVSETAGQVLSAAAVIGRSFALPLVRGTSGRSEDETVTALEELVRRGIVRDVPAAPEVAFDFAHAKLRDAAYEATSLARRRLLHRRTAELLRLDLPGRDDPARLVQVATHERAAGREAEAAEAFRQAGVRARALFANREAAAHLETAIALGHPDGAAIQILLGEVRTVLGDYTGAIAALEAAAAATSDDELPGVELQLGRVHARRGDFATAASHLDAAVATLELGEPAAGSRVLVRALVERAVVAHRAGELDLAHLAASRALDIAQAAGDDPGAGAAHRILGLIARETGDLDAARASLEQSLAMAATDPDAGAAIAARNALALVEAAAGDRLAAIALLETALGECRRTGERHLEAAVENSLADQLHAVGRIDDSMAHLKRAVAIFAEVGGSPGELEPEIWKLVAW